MTLRLTSLASWRSSRWPMASSAIDGRPGSSTPPSASELDSSRKASISFSSVAMTCCSASDHHARSRFHVRTILLDQTPEELPMRGNRASRAGRNPRRARRHSVPGDHETGSLSRDPIALSVLLDESVRTARRVDLMPPPRPLLRKFVPVPCRQRRTKPSDLQGVREVEPTGIEPVTSCLQSRRSPS